MIIILNNPIIIPDLLLKLSNTMPKALVPKVRLMLRPDGKELAILTERLGVYTTLKLNLIPDTDSVESIYTAAISHDAKLIGMSTNATTRTNSDIDRFCKLLWDKIRDKLRDNVTASKVKPIIKHEFPNLYKPNDPDFELLFNKYSQNLERYNISLVSN